MKRYALENIDELYNFIDNNKIGIMEVELSKNKQLRNCQAWAIPCKVIDNDGIHNGYLLQSYYTIVGLKYNGMLFTWNRYSRTTSRQLTWFDRDYK